MKLTDIKTEDGAHGEGVWIGDIPALPGVRLKVRARGNVEYQRSQKRLLSALSQEERRNGLDAQKADDLEAELLATTVLRDWTGLEGDDGGDLPFSIETAQGILANPEFHLIRSGVEWAAGRAALPMGLRV